MTKDVSARHKMERDVIVRDVGPRDGLQLVKTVLPTEVKLAWLQADIDAGIPEVEVCSFVPAKVIAQFGDAFEVASHAGKIGEAEAHHPVGKIGEAEAHRTAAKIGEAEAHRTAGKIGEAEAHRTAGFVPSALTPNLKGAQIGFQTGIAKINYVMSVSETHNQQNVRRSREESLQGFKDIIAARDAIAPNVQIGIGLATALGCTLEGHVPEDETLRILELVLEAGADEVMLPDTVGYANPSQVRSLFAKAIPMAGDIPVWTHFHDTRGLGLANALAALEAGARRFDASIAGLGGCPFAPGATGNIVLEDLVFLLEAEGMATGIDIPKLAACREIVEKALPDEPKYGQVLRAGLPKGFQSAVAA
ncbi:MAG: hydroxymethylglutaryl-CoA lyase [Pseudomonadota bacterium]